MADWMVVWEARLEVGLTMRVPGGQWVPVDWQVCREMWLMAMVFAPTVWRRRPSRGRMDGSILFVGGFLLLMGTVYGDFTFLLWSIWRRGLYGGHSKLRQTEN